MAWINLKRGRARTSVKTHPVNLNGFAKMLMGGYIDMQSANGIYTLVGTTGTKWTSAIRISDIRIDITILTEMTGIIKRHFELLCLCTQT